MDDPLGVGELQTPARLRCYGHGLLKGQPVLRSVLQHTLHVSAAHQLGDHERLSVVVSQVEHRDDVGVGAQSAHGLGLPVDTGHPYDVQTLGLYQGEGYVPVQQVVVGQVHHLLAALAQEPLHLVPPIGEGGGRLRLGGRCWEC